MLKKAVQQGRSKRRGDAYSVRYVEPLSEARTPLADFFSILLGIPHGSLNRFAHSDCMVAGIPLQVTPPSMIYVVSSDTSHPFLHLPNH